MALKSNTILVRSPHLGGQKVVEKGKQLYYFCERQLLN